MITVSGGERGVTPSGGERVFNLLLKGSSEVFRLLTNSGLVFKINCNVKFYFLQFQCNSELFP